MPIPVNELGEFILHDEIDGELERRKRIYSSCVKVDPKKARGPEPKMPLPRKFKEPAIGFCEECGASFEKNRHNQRFCSRNCQKKNYNAERRLQRKLRREYGL